MTTFNDFAKKFNKSDDSKPSTQKQIDELEKKFSIHLPRDYKSFLLHIGNIWTPDILDIIVDRELDMDDVQDFWEIDSIIYDKENEWTARLTVNLLPFASDCMGNIFSFLMDDLKTEKETAEIYFFDHDFDTIEKISNSFTEWIDAFNKL